MQRTDATAFKEVRNCAIANLRATRKVTLRSAQLGLLVAALVGTLSGSGPAASGKATATETPPSIAAAPTATPSVAGFWAGTLTQPGGTITTLWNEQLNLLQDSTGAVSGTRYSAAPEVPEDYVTWSVSGRFVLLFPSFWELILNDVAIVATGNPSINWCVVTTVLPLSSDGTTLSGNWGSSTLGCGGGSVSLTAPTGATPTSVLLDPVPQLLAPEALKNGQSPITTDTDVLASKGLSVNGVAADGVTQVVVRILANSATDQFTLTLLNDQVPPVQSGSTGDDGALGQIGDTNFHLSQLSVSAVDTSSGPTAFAIYRAPIDFPRAGGQDATATSRQVTIQVQPASGPAINVPIVILRPPVVLVHGLWGDKTGWDSFKPLIGDSCFSVSKADYSGYIGNRILAFTPIIDFGVKGPVVSWARANSLGFSYNAPNVFREIGDAVNGFKFGGNPVHVPVAAVQADIVAHSMGGDIARTIPTLPNFLAGSPIGMGNMHKLITIDTPHLGSVLATDLLELQNTCVRQVLDLAGNFSFDSVQFYSGATTGAVGDLQLLSPAIHVIQNPQNPNVHKVPTALVAAKLGPLQLQALDSPPGESLTLQVICGATILSNPLAADLTETGWPTLFDGEDNDAIVPLSSQVNGGAVIAPNPFTATHSAGAEALGFGPPQVLDQDSGIPSRVIDLLNTPVTDPVYTLLP